MLLAILICSDEDCPTVAEEVGTLEELDSVLCADCDCLMQIVAIEEAEAPRVVQLHPRASHAREGYVKLAA